MDKPSTFYHIMDLGDLGEVVAQAEYRVTGLLHHVISPDSGQPEPPEITLLSLRTPRIPLDLLSYLTPFSEIALMQAIQRELAD